MKILNIRNILLIGFLISIITINNIKTQETSESLTDPDSVQETQDDGTVDYEQSTFDNKNDDHETSDGSVDLENEAKEKEAQETTQEPSGNNNNQDESQTQSQSGDQTSEDGNSATDADKPAQNDENTTQEESGNNDSQNKPTEEDKNQNTDNSEQEKPTEGNSNEQTNENQATQNDNQPNPDQNTEGASEDHNQASETTQSPVENPSDGEPTEGEKQPDEQPTEGEKQPDEQPTEGEKQPDEQPTDGQNENTEAQSSNASESDDDKENPTKSLDATTVQIITVADDSTDDDQQKMTTAEDDESSGDATDLITIGSDVDPETTVEIKVECSQDEFKCDNKCFSNTKRCDTVIDCSDGSDESNCPTQPVAPITSTPVTVTEPQGPNELTLYINPDQEIINVVEGSSFEFTCTARGPYPSLQVLVYKDQQPIEQSDTGSVTIKFDNIKQSDSGKFLCYGFPEDRSTYKVTSVEIVVSGKGVETVETTTMISDTKFKEVTGDLDSTVDLECAYSNEENVKWRKVDNNISEYVREHYGKLYIYYLKEQDAGVYECETPDGRRDQVRLRVLSSTTPRPTTTQTIYDEGTKFAVRAYLKESTLTYKTGDTVVQECDAMTNGPEMEILWFNHRKQQLSNNNKYTISTTTSSESPLSKLSTLTIKNANFDDSGYYECVVVVGSQRQKHTFELQQETDKPPVTPVCAIDEATCRNGQCIPRSGLCDGRIDCSDGSDESNCGGSNTGRCEPNEKECRNSKCVQKIWFCDGENDCGDNSDEDQCPQPKPGEFCKTHEFLCRNGQQCVLKGFVCDGEYDCLDRSDEIGCEKPSIIRGPVRNLTVILGGTIRIECEASGFPSPYINWRLNWGHVCEEPRCISTTENGKGVLTITDARLSDAGAYSCEALNSKGRVFAVPDAIVYVQVGTFSTTRLPTTPSSTTTLRQPAPTATCNPYGSYTKYPPCQCKPYGVSGPYCDKCPDRKFHLIIENRNSYCAQCFCNGLQVNCRSGNLFYSKIQSNFNGLNDGWSLNNRNNDLSTSVYVREQSLVFSDFNDFRGQDLFFYAPSKYLGNRLASYAGNLTFFIRYEGPASTRPRKLEVRLGNSRYNLVHRVNRLLYPYQDMKVNLLIVEDEFKNFGNNARIDREQLLIVLANLEYISIKVNFIDSQYSVSLSQVSLDHADQTYQYSPADKRALAVESCDCPIGYTGISCESCAPGYKKVPNAYGLGVCERSSDVEIVFPDAPNNEIVLTPGQNHVIYVTVIGSGENVIWVKEPEGYLPSGVVQQDNNLIIQNARPEISGNYTCYIYTPRGEIKRILVITIPSVPREPPKIYSPSPRVLTLGLGERFVLECSAYGEPRPSVRIVAPSNPNKQYAPAYLRGENQQMPETSARFEVNYFTAENAGTYLCIADNGLEAIEKFEVKFRSANPPFIQIYPKEIEAYEGSSLTINYTITGTEPVQIRVQLYSAQNQPLTSIVVDKDTKQIEIRQITKDMEGQYLIEASNDYGRVQDYFILRVLEAPGPRITLSETVIRTFAGSNVRIDPVVQYSGRASFSWNKDGSSLPYGAQVDRQTLYIPSVSKEHQGTYTLTLRDDIGIARVAVNLIVQDRIPTQPNNPTRIIVKYDTEVELDIGQNANLLCQIHLRNSNPRLISTTSWIRGNRAQRERFSSNIRPNQERLQIIKVKPSDAGQYTCIVSSSDGTTQVAVVNLIVKNPTTTYEPPTAKLNEREKTIAVGDSFDLLCTVTGSPIPTVVWYFNNEKIENLENVYIRGTNLIARNAQLNLNGYFSCRAVSSDGRVAEDSAFVRVLPETVTEPPVTPVLNVQVTPSSSNNNVDETLSLSCSVLDADGNSYPSNNLRYTWTKQDGSLPSGSYASNDVLILYNLKPQDAGTYICEVENIENGLRNQGASVVSVSGEVQGPSEPLRVQVTPKEIQLIQGRNGELVCNVQGGRNPVITWKKSGETLDPARHIVQGNKLLIRNASPNDRGYFECEVQSDDDFGRDYALVELEPREAPQIEIYPNEERVDVKYGATTYLQCRINAGVPAPTLEWVRSDGRQLSSKVNILQDGNLLQVNDVGADELGDYECVARNEEGESRSRIRIESQDKTTTQKPTQQTDEISNAPDVILNTRNVRVQKGETVTLECKTSSRVPVRYDWSGPNGDYLGGEPDGSLVLTDVKKSASGYYTCQVVNAYGSSRDQINVEVIEEEEPKELHVEVRPKSKTVSEGGSAEFVCNVKTENGEPVEETQIRWSRSGNLELPRYHSIRGNVLNLYNVNENDGGRYMCTVQASYNRIGFDAAYLQISRKDNTSAFPVYIRVLESPTDSYQPTAAYRYGVRVTAECVAQADDVEEVTWSKSEGVSRAVYERSENSNKLIIPALLPMDLGTYVCIVIRRNGERAQNSIIFTRVADQGSQFTYQVTGPTEEVVLGQDPKPEQPEQPEKPEQPEQPEQPESNLPPKATILGPKEINANEGGSASIECEVEGSDKAELTKHGESLPENHRVERNGRNHVLKLYNLLEKDSGYYLCNIENKNGPARDHVYLSVSKTESESDNRDEDRERDERERLERERLERERLEREREQQQQNQNKPIVYIKTMSNGAIIRPGEELRVVCLVNDPDAQVFFGRYDGQADDRVRSLVNQNEKNLVHELIFSPFEPQDASRYRCYARNRHGESEDSAIIELEADESFSFKTEKSQNNDLTPGLPHAKIDVIGSVEEGSFVELNCKLQDENGIQAKSYSWTRYPNLPQSAQAEENRLNIRKYDNNLDNGLYTCAISTDDTDYEKTRLIASNDYLLSRNPFFRFSRSEEEGALEVKCRPDSSSTYVWKTNNEQEESFRIEGDTLVLYRSNAVNQFSCVLSSDSEYGPITLDLEVNEDLIGKAFEKVNVDLNSQQNGANAKVECQPGEDC